MDIIFANSYLMSSIGKHLDNHDIANTQQTCNTLYHSLSYQKCVIRKAYSAEKFKKNLINHVLRAQANNTQRNIFRMYTYCIKHPYDACLLFREKPQIFENLMNRLERFESKKKYNQHVVKYFMSKIPLVYANVVI